MKFMYQVYDVFSIFIHTICTKLYMRPYERRFNMSALCCRFCLQPERHRPRPHNLPPTHRHNQYIDSPFRQTQQHRAEDSHQPRQGKFRRRNNSSYSIYEVYSPCATIFKFLNTCEYDRLNIWNSALSAAWYIRHVRRAFILHYFMSNMCMSARCRI